MTGSLAARQEGFTLIELLVVMLAGMVILIATLGFLEFTMKQSARATDRVEATQRGRTAMEQLVQELHSSCVAAEDPPIWTGSDASHLWFMAALSSQPVITPNLHEIFVNSGTLTDYAWAPTGGTSPNWTYNTANPPTTKRAVLTNVATYTSNGTTQPLFQYYQYLAGALSQLTTMPLNATDAGNAVSVTINFAAQPSHSVAADRTINLSDSALLRGYQPNAKTATLPCP
jgi:type II secretory pathway pseudopilin PulG